MPIRRLAIASERDDARQRAGLRLHVAMGITRFHALLQRAIDTSDRQGLLQLLIHILVTIGIAKELHLQFGTQIVVERETGTIGEFVASRIESYLAYQLPLHVSRTLGTGRSVACRSRYLVVHALGIEIVALLHHLVQYLVHRMETGTNGERSLRTAFHGCPETSIEDARILQLAKESIHKQVFPSEHQWREHRVVIIPAPSLAQEVVVLHRAVGIDAALDAIHTQFLQAGDERRHVVGVESRVHAAHAVDVAIEHAVLHRARIFEGGLKLIRAAQLIQCGNRRHEFHGAGRSHQLAFTEAIDARIRLQVPHHDAHLRGLKHLAFQQIVQAHLHSVRPRQGVGSQAIHHEGVGDSQFVLVVGRLFFLRLLFRIVYHHLGLQRQAHHHHSQQAHHIS